MRCDLLCEAFWLQYSRFLPKGKYFLHEIVCGMEKKFKPDMFRRFTDAFLGGMQRKTTDVFALMTGAF